LAGLKSVEAVELRHLNVNGRNSEPNMRKVYCGGVNCQNTSLLRLYKQAGYSTSLLESYNYQLPNYIPSNAVDRILASNYFAEYNADTVELYNKKSGCVAKTTWIVDEMLNYLQDRFMMMRRGGWFSINNIIDAHSEDELNNYAVMDSKFYDFLVALDQSKALDNTILILLGDHGLHGHDWAELWREFDHRNPFLQIIVGKQVASSADIIRHLEANRDKLVSHADIYTTFANFSSSVRPLILPNTIDLIQDKILATRTCRDAGIPDEWCNCWLPKASSTLKQEK
jgi:hypothetical protein